MKLSEVGDGDDNQQVKSHSEHSDEGAEEHVEDVGLGARMDQAPAGQVEELRVAELTSLQTAHHPVLRRVDDLNLPGSAAL